MFRILDPIESGLFYYDKYRTLQMCGIKVIPLLINCLINGIKLCYLTRRMYNANKRTL